MTRSNALFSCMCIMLLSAFHLNGQTIPQDPNSGNKQQAEKSLSSPESKYEYKGKKEDTYSKKFKELANDNKIEELTEYLHIAEVKNDPQVQYYMGICYSTGFCFDDIDMTKAIAWLDCAAAQDDDDAQVMLAEIYLYGFLGEINEERGSFWLNRALEKNNPRALFILGMQYFNGDGQQKNEKKSLEIFEFLASQNHERAQHHLGLMYYHGNGCEKDFKRAFELWKKASDEGMAAAQYDLAGLYYAGEGTAINKELGRKYLDMSANQGYAKAEYAKGMFLIEEGNNEAMDWLCKAADQGHEAALAQLAYIVSKTKKPLFKQGNVIYPFKEGVMQCLSEVDQKGHTYILLKNLDQFTHVDFNKVEWTKNKAVLLTFFMSVKKDTNLCGSWIDRQEVKMALEPKPAAKTSLKGEKVYDNDKITVMTQLTSI